MRDLTKKSLFLSWKSVLKSTTQEKRVAGGNRHHFANTKLARSGKAGAYQCSANTLTLPRLVNSQTLYFCQLLRVDFNRSTTDDLFVHYRDESILHKGTNFCR